MQRLTSQGQEIVDDLARRHGFSTEAVTHMLRAVRDGNGAMAQFSHPEFSGAGQWMRGGLLMLSDMFNHVLKGRVDALCHEISDLLASQPGGLPGGSFQFQSQGVEGATGLAAGSSGLFTADPDAHWWPTELGTPNATGAQGQMRYAYFGEARRLAVKHGEDVRLYDTLDHRIAGFSQQQGASDSVTFTSQYGSVDLTSLPLVSQLGAARVSPRGDTGDGESSARPASREADIIGAIERLGELNAKGVLTDEEFAAKKAELLARL